MWKFTVCGVVLALLVAVDSIGMAQADPSWPSTCGFIRYPGKYPNTDNYTRTADVDNEDKCADICSKDSGCGMYTWRSDNSVCYRHRLSGKLWEKVGLPIDSLFNDDPNHFLGTRDCEATMTDGGEGAGQGEVKQDPDGRSGTISMKPPDLNDEEAQSQHMPEQFQCEACKIIVYQMEEKFAKANAQHSSLKGDLPESIIMETVDSVCRYSYENYGVKEVDGEKRLSGPGTDVNDVPGVMQGGGRWPPRFHQMCDGLVGEVGEVEIYTALREGKLTEVLCEERDPEFRILGSCVQRKGKKKTKEVKKKKEEKKKGKEEVKKGKKEKKKSADEL